MISPCLRAANQETIVELIGFTQRVLGSKSAKQASDSPLAARVASTSLLSVATGEDEAKVAQQLERSLCKWFCFFLFRIFFLLLVMQNKTL